MAKNANKTYRNTPKKGIKENLRYQAEYSEFIAWIALPEEFRVPKTQGGLAKKFGVCQDTLSDWKKIGGFWDVVKAERQRWGKERTPNVILGLYRKAVKEGNAAEAKLWLQYIEGWTEKKDIEAAIKTIPGKEYDYSNLTKEELKRAIREELENSSRK